MKEVSQTRVLGIFTVAMLSVSAILSLRNVPIMATLGFKCIFFYGLAALCFLIPSAFVAAELSTRANTNGGVYAWVKAALGEKAGFVAIWMEWINNVIGFPATLSTIIATFTYVAFPQLLSHRFAFFICIMIVFWGCTFYNFTSVKIATGLNIVGALFGMILPGALIIILGLVWIGTGHQSALTNFSIIPHFSNNNFVLFISAISGYSGMQILAFHAKNVKNPKRTFPIAIMLSFVIILILSIVASISVALVVPADKLNIMNGLIEGFYYFFSAFHLGFLTKPLALCLVIGSVASLSAWMLGPARAISVVAQDELLPKIMAYRNKNEMPVVVLIVQGVIGTILASLFLFLPSMQMAFWILVALTSQFTIFMYILIFISAIKLRYMSNHIKDKDAFQIPGGKPLLWIVTVVGIITCCIGFVFGLIPPNLSSQGFSTVEYISIMAIGDIVIIFAPILWIQLTHNKKISK